MRLTILGGGGFRVPLVYEAVARGAATPGTGVGMGIDDVVLHDVDQRRLTAIEHVIRGVISELPEPARAPRLRTTTDLDDAVSGADFIFCAIRVGGAQGRTVDERVAMNLGLLGQETIGPGGLAYALRTIPVAHHLAQTIANRAPNAWVINFTNPAGIVTEAMQAVLGDRVVGICDTPIGLVRRVVRLLDLDLVAEAERIDYDYVGLNHLGWLRGVRIDGADALPGIIADDAALDAIEEARLIGADWVRAEGALPNEYLYYYLFAEDARRRIAAADTTRGEFLLAQQGHFYDAVARRIDTGQAGVADDVLAGGCCDSPLSLWRRTLRQREATYMAESREQDQQRREEDIAGGGYQEVALRLMNAIATGQKARMILDVANGSLGFADGSLGDNGSSRSASPVGGDRVVPELPADLVIEVPCDVDADGIHPRAVGPVRLDHLGRMARLRASERLIMHAALTGDRERAWQGFSCHPLVDSPRLGRALLEGYEKGHPEIAALLRSASTSHTATGPRDLG
ncbi:family 4 glycosyl hydrolase [Devriesea agamarum]|uniref:family 4 glycosyl hydrolase n=1 Tax=Devriesea agamarum TaxID=472569 RepID=UPI00071C9B7A|nr:6-phospho-beta-glucosidase [Devriesea agamarum]